MSDPNNLSIERAPDGAMVIRLAGVWRLRHGMASISNIENVLETAPKPHRVAFDTGSLSGWDSSLVNFVTGVSRYCHSRGIEADRDGLPPGLRRLLELAEATPERAALPPIGYRPAIFDRIGAIAIRFIAATGETLGFLGDTALAFLNFFTGRARFRRTDLVEAIQQCGADALGIVALISFLVGTILAFMGAVQLSKFGASIYVANLVAIGMVREMGAMMTGIIMAGRTGAAFAARLGTMKVTQEMDALTTMGLSPMEFLVVPRIIALIIMMPLLCLYADFFGIVGGAAVGIGMLKISPANYLFETMHSIYAAGFISGLVKAAAYGALIAFCGCSSGFRCGNSSSAVGDAATEAVVNGIIAIVVACGIFAVISNVLGI